MSDLTPTNWSDLQGIYLRTPPGHIVQLVAEGKWIGCYRTPVEIDIYYLSPEEREQYFVASFLTLVVETSRFRAHEPTRATSRRSL